MNEPEKDGEPTLEERLYRVERILGLRPKGELVFTGQLTDLRSVPGPGNSRVTVAVGGGN
jgi:hypothetical protein